MADDKRRVSTTLEEANEVGFLGVEVDPTPDHAYTVAGVIAGEPTPETDADAAAAAGMTFGRGSADDEASRPRAKGSKSSSSSKAEGGDK